MEISLVVPQKTGHDTSGGPCYTSPGHIPRGFPGMQQGHMLHYVHSSLIYNRQKLERTQVSLSGGMDTENVVYLHNGIYSAIRNNEFTKFLGKLFDLENIILSEVIQSQKNTHEMQSLISGY